MNMQMDVPDPGDVVTAKWIMDWDYPILLNVVPRNIGKSRR